MRSGKIAADSKGRKKIKNKDAVAAKRQTQTDCKTDSPVPAQTGNSAKASDKLEVATGGAEKGHKT